MRRRGLARDGHRPGKIGRRRASFIALDGFRTASGLRDLGDRALELLDSKTTETTDKELRYFAELIRGQVLRARGRTDDAIAAFRAAQTAWPGAQAARVALMTLLIARGNRDEAAALAEASQAGAAEEFDPWWLYWLGDYRAYPAIIGKLRSMAQ